MITDNLKERHIRTRSRAGFVGALDGSGVWVRFDEAVTRGA
ncbi:hypothetical protein [Pseudorhodobacter antarcticus]|nr:hypothetical protein [Pseudorhodobacter antarcticus]